MKKINLLVIALFLVKSFAAAPNSFGKFYDCAANCLYLFCSLNDSKITYEKSIELLPITKNGNSMLEFCNALQKCGFETDAKMIKTEHLAKVKHPSIVLHFQKNKSDQVGHYFVIMPENDQITVYDYPQDIQTYPVDFLISSLKQNGINEFPIIIYKPDQKSGSSKDNSASIGSRIIFEDFSRSFMGELDFGNQPESKLVKCNFDLKNSSDDSIEIKNLAADCKCSKIYTDTNFVEPGKSCKITMEISLVNKYKDVAVKARAKILRSNGQESTDLLMLARGYSEPRVLCEPQRVDFGTVRVNSGTVRFEGLNIRKTEASGNQVITRIKQTASKVSLNNIKEGKDVVKFDIALDTNDSFGLQKSKIEIFLDNESQPANYFDVIVFLKQDFSFSPQIAIIKEDKEAIVTITSEETSFAVKKVSIDDKAKYFEVSFSNKDDHSLVTISNGEDKATELIEDFVEVYIRCNSGKESIIKIPFVYIPAKYL